MFTTSWFGLQRDLPGKDKEMLLGEHTSSPCCCACRLPPIDVVTPTPLPAHHTHTQQLPYSIIKGQAWSSSSHRCSMEGSSGQEQAAARAAAINPSTPCHATRAEAHGSIQGGMI
jgi:hypothetical protein